MQCIRCSHSGSTCGDFIDTFSCSHMSCFIKNICSSKFLDPFDNLRCSGSSQDLATNFHTSGNSQSCSTFGHLI